MLLVAADKKRTMWSISYIIACIIIYTSAV